MWYKHPCREKVTNPVFMKGDLHHNLLHPWMYVVGGESGTSTDLSEREKMVSPLKVGTLNLSL